MLHELLFALSGHPGSIFVQGPDDQIQLVSDLPFIHPTELSLLNRVCKLATHYQKFLHFVRNHGHTPGGGDQEGLHGLYMRALCQGLEQVLDPYRQDLLGLEQDLLKDPHLTAGHVQSKLEQYQLLFPAITATLEQISVQKAHGCLILEILHKRAASGLPIVRNALLTIQHCCHRVFYKQLTAWMLHGMLMDQYNEFFIHKAQVEAAEQSSQMEEDELGLGGLTGKQLRQLLKLSADEEDRDVPIQKLFGLVAEKLPSYIPARIAEKILFVGESVQMFQTEKQQKKFKYKGSILKSKEDAFAKELQVLSEKREFVLMEFEEVIDKIRTCAAEQLWQVVVEEAELVNNLKTMKDFYLLGRGELFLAFIDQAQGLLRPLPGTNTQHDVNMAFQQAARNVLFEDDNLLQQFQFLVPADPRMQNRNFLRRPSSTKSVSEGSQGEVLPTTGNTENGWNALKMTYRVEWPLHIVFTQPVLDRYNTVFKFLLSVKRIQQQLQHCWALQMKQKKQLCVEEADSAKWWLRNHMAFLVDNLQYYLQVDVIESQFSLLQEQIETTRDFEAIRLAHDQFLTALLSQSFLHMKPISHCLHEILDLCHNFCTLVGQAEETLTEREIQYMDTIAKNFQRQSNLLFRILSSVRSHQTSPHLAQLLLRLDFNKYFTLAGGQLGRYTGHQVDEST